MLFGVFQKGIVACFIVLCMRSLHTFFLVFSILLHRHPTGSTPKMLTDGWHF